MSRRKLKTSIYTILYYILDASLDGLGGGTVDSVHTVGTVVLLVVQEPAGIRKASHLDPGVSQSLQQLRHVVHVQQDPGATGTAHRNTPCYRDRRRMNRDAV